MHDGDLRCYALRVPFSPGVNPGSVIVQLSKSAKISDTFFQFETVDAAVAKQSRAHY